MISASDILRSKVLIVDDQQADVLLLERMLHGAGYTCVASTTEPHEVCALHLENRYDLILLDLQMRGMDGFKQINDTLGHSVGDDLLKMVAGRLVATMREEDTVARLGGDEFVIAMWHISGSDHVAKVASKVIGAVAQPYLFDGHPISITVSAGIGIYPVHGEDADTLMESADLALYAAKHAGKNAFRISEGNHLRE